MYHTILFDLDGTLTDSALGITRCIQYSLQKMGIEESNLEKLKSCIGPSLLESYGKLYGMDEKTAWKAIAFYRERFDRVGILENSLYPGVEQMLIQLTKAQKRMLLATAKPTVQAQAILEHYGLTGHFHTIMGSNLDGTRIQKHEVIACDLKELGFPSPEGIVMVGDREHDVLGAKKHRLKCIGVTYGYGTRQELMHAGADCIVDSVEELTRVLLEQ